MDIDMRIDKIKITELTLQFCSVDTLFSRCKIKAKVQSFTVPIATTIGVYPFQGLATHVLRCTESSNIRLIVKYN